MPFSFDSGLDGWVKEEPGKSIIFAYCSNDRTVEMYVGYEGENDWFADNYDTILTAATSLHDTE